MVKPLTVYKASAGSGKTFTLAAEYISLLVENPMNYRTILAVTFTNKATEEMKMRILSQLYGIWKQLSDSDKYLKAVQEKTGRASASPTSSITTTTSVWRPSTPSSRVSCVTWPVSSTSPRTSASV